MKILMDIISGANFHLVFDVDLMSDEFVKSMEVTTDYNSKVYTYLSTEYKCEIEVKEFDKYRALYFNLTNKENKEFTINKYGIEGTIDCVDTIPYCYRNAPPGFVLSGRETSNISTFVLPFILYGSRKGYNRLAIGFGNKHLETEKIFGLNHVTREEALTQGVDRPSFVNIEKYKMYRPYNGMKLKTNMLRDMLFVSTDDDTWFNTASEYHKWVQNEEGYQPIPYPDSLLGPVWNSWCYFTEIDQELILENAKIAKELGVKSVVIDCGWFHKSSDESIWFTEALDSDQIEFGRLKHVTNKFPDFKGMINTIQKEMGMAVWLWIPPRYTFTLQESGEKAVDPRLLKGRVRTRDGELTNYLCMRNPDARKHAIEVMKNAFQDYNLDGWKSDFWYEWDDSLVCFSDEHEHDCQSSGEGMKIWLEEVYEAVNSSRDAFAIWTDVQGGQQFGNYRCTNEIYSNIDAIYLHNLQLKSLQIHCPNQPCAGGFHKNETDVNVAKYMAVTHCGLVPELLMDLLTMKDSHKRIVKAWFKFWEQHKRDLIYGEFTPVNFECNIGGPYGPTPLPVKIQSDHKAFIWVTPVDFNEVKLDDGTEKVYLYNIKNRDGIRLTIDNLQSGKYIIRIKDIFLDNVSEDRMHVDGVLKFDRKVPESGMAEIIRI